MQLQSLFSSVAVALVMATIVGANEQCRSPEPISHQPHYGAPAHPGKPGSSPGWCVGSTPSHGHKPPSWDGGDSNLCNHHWAKKLKCCQTKKHHPCKGHNGHFPPPPPPPPCTDKPHPPHPSISTPPHHTHSTKPHPSHSHHTHPHPHTSKHTGPPPPHHSTKPVPHTSTKPKPHTSTKPKPSTSTKPKPHTSTKPKPSTSTKPKPHTSTKPKPSTSTKPKPSTSTKPKPSTSTKPKPSTSTKPKPSTSTKPKPSTSTKPKPSTSTKPKPSTSTKPKPSTSTKPKPSTSTKPKPSTSTKPPKPSTSTKPKPSTSTSSTSTAPPKPSHKPTCGGKVDGPACVDEFKVVFTNYTVVAKTGYYKGQTVGAAIIDIPNYITYGLVDTLAECFDTCSDVEDCVFVNTYHEYNSTIKDHYGKGKLTCALFAKCSNGCKATNYGGQDDPTYVVDSNAYCKSKHCQV